MKLIDLQCLMDGDVSLIVQKHDAYTISTMEIILVKQLDNSKFKDEEIDLIHPSNNSLIVRV